MQRPYLTLPERWTWRELGDSASKRYANSASKR